MFASLTERNFRLFMSGKIVSDTGIWMQRVAQDWLVLTLSGRSPMALGIAAALQFIPTLVLSVWAGVLADRLDKRKLLIGLDTGLAACALVLGVLNVTGAVALWQVYVICFVSGCFSAMESTVRQSFVMDIVGRKQLTNAVAINSMTFNLARIVGPALAGVMITWVGTGWVFLITVIAFGGVISGLIAMDPKRLYPVTKVARERGQLAEAIRYVRGQPTILLVMVLVFCVSTFGMTFFTTLANAAANVFHRSASGYGLLSTLLAVGTLVGATLAARRSANGRPRQRVLLTGALLFGLLESALALMPTYTLFGLMLIPVGIFLMTFTTACNSTVQLSVAPEMRGRVMGLYMLVFLGGNPIAGPLTGWLATAFGGRAPFLFGGVVSVVAAVVCGLVLVRRNGGLRLRSS
jgi:MFS family permease